jgi:Na+/H+ antiporter NhaC
MRDMTPAWPRWLGFLMLATLAWWAVVSYPPGRSELARAAFAHLGAHQLTPELETLRGSAPALLVGRLDATWTEECKAGLAGRLDKALEVRPEVDLVARVACRSDGREAALAFSLEAPNAKRFERTFTKRLPTGLSLWPPLLAVLIAIVFGRIYAALAGALWAGALIVEDFAIGSATSRTLTIYLYETLVDPFNLLMFAFSLVLVGMIHVSIACGGMQGIIDAVARVARGFRTTQVAVGLMGIGVFFDDYSSSLLTGSSGKSLTDQRGISREKLAYIVDSTAAPVAGLAVISTWIGYQVGLFQNELDSPEMAAIAGSGYDLFFQILPYRFYCIFAIVLVFLVALMGRDFGPMLRAERRAREGAVHPNDPGGPSVERSQGTVMKEGVRARWVNGVLPMLVVLIGSFVGYAVVGASRLPDEQPFTWYSVDDLARAFGAVTLGSGTREDEALILLLGALAGAATAVLLAMTQRLLTLFEVVGALGRGVRSMLPAIAILVLAIGIRQVTADVDTASYLSALLGHLGPMWLPLGTFLLACGIACATGTSWGTMGILMPVAIPTAVALVGTDPQGTLIILLVASAVLDGAIFGDHCAIVSDTTILSSLASGCPPVAHFKTQLPYALLAMVAAGACGYGLTAFTAVDPMLAYGCGIGLMVLWMLVVGRASQVPRGKRRA